MPLKPPSLYGQVWLIVSSGGWWRREEIAGFLASSPPDLHVRLRWMRRSGYLESREIPTEKRERADGRKGPAERMEYAVTNDCLVPHGVTAGAMARAITGEVLR